MRYCCATADVRFGSKADMCGAKGHVRFAPNSDRESGHEISEPEILLGWVASASILKSGACQGAGCGRGRTRHVSPCCHSAVSSRSLKASASSTCGFTWQFRRRLGHDLALTGRKVAANPSCTFHNASLCESAPPTGRPCTSGRAASPSLGKPMIVAIPMIHMQRQSRLVDIQVKFARAVRRQSASLYSFCFTFFTPASGKIHIATTMRTAVTIM